MTTKDLSVEEIIRYVGPLNDYENIDSLNFALDNLMEVGRFNDVETIVKQVSDSRILLEVISNNNSSLDFFKRFVDYKFEDKFNENPYNKERMLFSALYFSKMDIVEYLFSERKVEPQNIDSLEFDKPEVIKFLLDNKIIDVNYFIKSKNKFLIERVIWLCEKYDCDIDLLKYLIENGADISVNNYEPIRTMIYQYDQTFSGFLFDLIVKLHKNK